MSLTGYLECLFGSDKSPFESAIIEKGEEPDHCLLKLKLQSTPSDAVVLPSVPEITLQVYWNTDPDVITFTQEYAGETELDAQDPYMLALLNQCNSHIGRISRLTVVSEGIYVEVISAASFLVPWPETDNAFLAALMRANIAHFIVEGSIDVIDFLRELDSPRGGQH